MSLSVEDLRILAHLSSQPNSSAAEIAQALGTNVFSTINALHLLVSKELATVTQQGDPRRWSIGKKGIRAGTSSKAAETSNSTLDPTREQTPRGSAYPGVLERNSSVKGAWQGPPSHRTRCRVCDLPLSPKDRNIMGFLRDHPGSQPKNVATALGLGDVVVKRALYDLKARGEVVVSRDGGPRRWSLKPERPQQTGRQLGPYQARIDFSGPDSGNGRNRSGGAGTSPGSSPGKSKSGRPRGGRSGALAPETVERNTPKARSAEPPQVPSDQPRAGVQELPEGWKPPPANGPRLIERLPQPLRRLIGTQAG